MKKVIFIMLMGIILSFSVTSCREKTEEKNGVVEEMIEGGADVKVKSNDDNTKIKVEDDDQKVKIKVSEDGDVKYKVDTKDGGN